MNPAVDHAACAAPCQTEGLARCGIEVGVPRRIHRQPQGRGGDHQRIALFRDGKGAVLMPVCLYSLGEIVLRFPAQKYAQNILRYDLYTQRAARSLTQHKAAVLLMLHHGFPFCGRLLFLPPLPSSMEFCAGGKNPFIDDLREIEIFLHKKKEIEKRRRNIIKVICGNGGIGRRARFRF